ncbi:MAG: Na+/H+ antiporter NhaC family protein [Bacillus sp. (in: firmicutes)]
MELSFLSLIPPILIIVLVLLTRKVILSLGAGIILSSLITEGGHIFKAIESVFVSFIQLFYAEDGWVTSNIYVLTFLILLGMLTGLLSASGGNRAFGAWIGRRIHTKESSQLMTSLFGVSLFPDDVFNMFATSQITKPVLDHNKVPRTKLAYLLHSTSDPTCVLCPLSSWGAYIIAILTSIFATIQLDVSPITAFMIIATTNFYAISTLMLVFVSASLDINLGKMKTLVPSSSPIESGEYDQQGRIKDMVIPVLLLVFGAIIMMVITGYKNSDSASLMTIFANSEVSLSLMLGSIIAICGSLILFRLQVKKQMRSYRQLPQIMKAGIKTTLPAVEILLFAWVLSAFIDKLGTGTYLAAIMDNTTLPFALMPLILFLLTGIMAFSTGTSWGTFAIMLPIAAQIAQSSDPSMMFFMMSAVLSGSLFGDHCSPVSDTTTVAAAAAGCKQIEHVVTQLPYAGICAGLTAFSFLLLGVTGLRIWPYLLIILVIGMIAVRYRLLKTP